MRADFAEGRYCNQASARYGTVRIPCRIMHAANIVLHTPCETDTNNSSILDEAWRDVENQANTFSVPVRQMVNAAQVK